MKNKTLLRYGCAISALVSGLSIMDAAHAGSFSIREQSAYFLGSAFAGSAAGGDISSMYWNSAATATLPGFNSYSSYSPVIARSDLTATGGVFVTPFSSNTTDIGTDSVVPASYVTYQLSDRLFAGLGLNSPFGFITKPDNTAWAGSPVAITSKVFSIDANPTLAYKLTPEITVGVGAQIEYVKARLNRTSFDVPGSPLPLAPFRSFNADDVSGGATAGVLWQPRPGTSIGLGYRSAVNVDLTGTYARSAFIVPPSTIVPGVRVNAAAGATLPDEVTMSVRQAVNQDWTFLATLEWQNWRRIQNVPITLGGVGLETLNFNYNNGWFTSIGAEYKYNPLLTFRAGVAFEKSPIEDSTRDILLPDSDRIHANIGASYKWSDKITFDVAYAHLFFDSAPFCIANPLSNGGTTHCTGRLNEQVVLRGSADSAVDLFSVGLHYKFGVTEVVETYK